RLCSFFSTLRDRRRSSLFPYPTLFRSADLAADGSGAFAHAHQPLSAVRFVQGGLGGPFPGGVGHRDSDRAAAAADSDRDVRVSRSEEHTSELQSRFDLVCRLLLETKND